MLDLGSCQGQAATFSDNSKTERTVQNWFAKLEIGILDLVSAPRPDRTFKVDKARLKACSRKTAGVYFVNRARRRITVMTKKKYQ